MQSLKEVVDLLLIVAVDEERHRLRTPAAQDGRRRRSCETYLHIRGWRTLAARRPVGIHSVLGTAHPSRALLPP
jgi:hypothetical protein